jgi:CheY-like chemotaxis protein
METQIAREPDRHEQLMEGVDSAIPRQQNDNPYKPSARHADLAGKRVLMVEDEPIVAISLEEMIRAMGADAVAWASDLPQALHLATEERFELAVLDINLKGQMSYPVVNELTARATPVVLATGYSREQLPNNLRSAPLLRKPYTEAQLATAITAVMSRIPISAQ